MLRLKIILFILLSCYAAHAQLSFNSEFESIGYDDKPLIWFMPANTHYAISGDSTDPYQGKYSGRIQPTDKAINYSSAVYYQTLDLSAFEKGRKITVKYHFKINKGWNTLIKYWIQPTNCLDNRKTVDTVLAKINGEYERGKWYEYEATAYLGSTASTCKSVYTGFIVQGQTDVNVDNIEVYIDGIKVNDLPLKQEVKTLPDDHDMQWLNNTLRPIVSIDDYNDLKDLNFLKNTIGNAQIVALGEGTHGTKEFNSLRGRIIKYLVENMGFEIVAFENGITETRLVNEFLKKDSLSAASIVDSLFGRVHETDEIASLFDWVRTNNKSSTKRKVFIEGFDDQGFYYILTTLKNALRLVDSTLYEEVSQINGYVRKGKPDLAKLDTAWRQTLKLVDLFFARKKKIVEKTSGEEMILLEKTLTSLKNALYLNCLYQRKDTGNNRANFYSSYTYRDSLMADNVIWLREYYNNKKIILWCHNNHIQKGNSASESDSRFYQGDFMVKAGLGSIYRNFAFLTLEGQVTGYKPGGWPAVAPLQTPYRSCYEYYFGQAKAPVFYVAMPSKKEVITKHQKILSGLKWRALGFGVTPGAEQFSDMDLLNKFDGIFFIRTTTPAASFYLKNSAGNQRMK